MRCMQNPSPENMLECLKHARSEARGKNNSSEQSIDLKSWEKEAMYINGTSGQEQKHRDAPLCIRCSRQTQSSVDFHPKLELTTLKVSDGKRVSGNKQCCYPSNLPACVTDVWQASFPPHWHAGWLYFLLLSQQSELRTLWQVKGGKQSRHPLVRFPGWFVMFLIKCVEKRMRTVPCCMREPTPNQKLLRSVKLFSTTSDPGLHGWASYHSYGLNLWQEDPMNVL